jgi:hypothetical protein
MFLFTLKVAFVSRLELTEESVGSIECSEDKIHRLDNSGCEWTRVDVKFAY